MGVIYIYILISKSIGEEDRTLELTKIKNEKHRAIIQDINDRHDTDTICKRHNISRPTFYRVKRQFGEALTTAEPTEITSEMVAGYNSKLINKTKHIAMRLANTLLSKSMTGASISQLTQSLINVNTMLRLEEGKSTENIAHNIVHNLNPEQLELIKDGIMNLKKSMLSVDT